MTELKTLKMVPAGEPTGGLETVQKLGIPKLDPNCQSVPLPESENIRVSQVVKDGKLITSFYDDVQTLYDAFNRGYNMGKDRPCLGWRPAPGEPYKWLTYDQVSTRSTNFGSGLIHKGVEAGQKTFLGIYSQNRIGWKIAEHACNMYSMILVPLYDTLGSEACSYIINEAELQTVVCDVDKRALLLLSQSGEMPKLKQLVMMDDAGQEVLDKAKEMGIEVWQFRDVEAIGGEHLTEAIPAKPDDLCTVCYTSGTTGNPKGAMLSHGNFIGCFNGQMSIQSYLIEYKSEDVYISYLPLAHVYERYAQLHVLCHGGKIGFYQGDIKLLFDDIKTLQPTIFPCVPRVMNKLHDKIVEGVNKKGGIKKWLFNKALQKKQQEIEKGIMRYDGLWDKIFKPVRAMTGGRVRFISTGAAPISKELKMFFRSVFGCLVLEGYGQTESGTLTSFTAPQDLSDGHVGAILPSAMVKLVDVPDLEYFSSNNQGEICIKGPNIFKGYLKNPEKTAETLDVDGWLHSGDVGEWLPGGQLRVIDRVKHIFKLSQGEYVAPEKIENQYVRVDIVAQVFVHGDSMKDCCIAVVVPDEEVLMRVAAANKWGDNFAELCKMNEVKEYIMSKMLAMGKEAKLKGFEQVRDIFLYPELFSIENNLLTPTFKAKRPIQKKFFKEQLDAMYASLDGKAPTKAAPKEMTTSGDSKANGSGATSNGEVEGGNVRLVVADVQVEGGDEPVSNGDVEPAADDVQPVADDAQPAADSMTNDAEPAVNDVKPTANGDVEPAADDAQPASKGDVEASANGDVQPVGNAEVQETGEN